MPIREIITGGQSGVDRGALEAARVAAIEYGGWCPKGGWAEDTPVAPGVRALYPLLVETPSGDPNQRTEWNICDSDAVLALADRRGFSTSSGTQTAIANAFRHRKPCLCVDIDEPDSLERTIAWLRDLPPELRLNVVGPRESESPGICAKSRRFLLDLLATSDRQSARPPQTLQG